MRRTQWLCFGLAVLLVPIVAAAVDLAGDGDFVAMGDIAGTELRTRDVGRHPVLVGLWSREDWNHPGPLLFYLLALPYRLGGSSSSGLSIGALLINGASLVGMALVARRRGGTPLFLLTVLGEALVMRALGSLFLRDPWNPYLPVLAFGLLVLLCWSMLCGDRWALPVASVVASFCVQTHVGYIPLGLPLLCACAAWLVWSEVRAGRGAGLVRTIAVTGLLLGVLWILPVYEQLQQGTGNLGRVWDYFLHSEEPVAGVAEAARFVGALFDPFPAWLSRDRHVDLLGVSNLAASTPVPVWLPVVGAAAVLLWRRREAEAVKLVAVFAASLALGVLAFARTFEPIYEYRLRWASVLGMLGFLIVAWASWILVRSRSGAAVGRYLTPLALAGLAVLGGRNSIEALQAPTPFADQSPVIGATVPDIVRALPPGDGPVVLRAEERSALIYQGVFLELERRGVDVRTEGPKGIQGSGAPHRVWRRGPVRAFVTVAVGEPVDKLLARRSDEVVAYWGTDTLEERIPRSRRLAVLDAQRQAGALDDLGYLVERDELGPFTFAVSIFMTVP